MTAGDVPKEPSPAEGMESIQRNAFFGLVTKLTTAFFTAGVTLFLVRALGPADYGLFALAMSVGALMLVPADLGISGSAARFIAERRDHLPSVVGVFSDALRVRLLTSLGVAVLLVALADPIAQAYSEPDLAWPLRAVAVMLVGQTLMQLSASALAALARQSAYLRVVASESALEATAMVGLVLLGGGAAGAAAGRAVGFFFGGLLAILAVGKLLGRPGLRRKVTGQSAGYTRRLVTYASALLLLNAAFTAFAQLDVVLIGAFLNATAVGLFEAPLRVAAFLHYPGMAAAEAIGPRLAQGSDEGPRVGAFENGLRLVIIVQLALSVPLVVWAHPIVELALGSDYGGSTETLRVLSVYAFLGGVGTVVAHAANYLGEARRRIPIAVITIVINLAIDVTLIPEIGIIAGAIGTGVAFAFYVPAHLWIVHRVLAIDMRRIGLTLVRALAAGAAFAGCLALFGTSSLSAPAWIAGSVAGVSIYLGVLLITREVAVSEVRDVVRDARSLLRSARPGR